LRRGFVDVVVATDVGSEGLNLQAAAYIVHADLPWTPARLEQRLGRVSRIGQRSERVEEIVLVPEQSSVAAILQRKAVARSRLASRRRGAIPDAPAPDRLDAREVAARDEELCVVDLVETRAGRGARGVRALAVSGRAGSLPDGMAIAAQLESESRRPAQGRDAVVDRVVEEWVGVARAREAQPARIDAHAPQTRLLAAAARAGVVTRELVELMSRRYRAGGELLIADLAAARVDERAVATLGRELGAEAAGHAPYEATVAGCRSTRGWLRSAARLRRGRR
jgi:superfamily II DNA/RNA helicase